MKKFFLSLLVGFLIVSSVKADEINKFVKKSSFGLSSDVGIYIVDSNQNKIIYKKNENKQLNPASTLKVLTFGVAYDVLGSDYKFETALYKDCDNNIYIKLGGDALLTQKNLNNLISNLKSQKINQIYIDDSIFDKEQYPNTWLEEDKWPNQRMISPYIIDYNFVDIHVHRSSLAKKIDIIQDDEYKFSFVNELNVGDKNEFNIVQLYGDDSLIVNLQGEVNKDIDITLPVLRPDINFNVKLNKALDENNIAHNIVIKPLKTPVSAKKIASVSHDINEISRLILHNSDNFAAEVIFKVAAAKYYNKDYASLDDAILMFEKYYSVYLSKNDKIADASGVSRQNKFCVKTMINCLDKLFKNSKFKNLLATSNEGTLEERLLFLKDNLRAKTGTMRNLSAFCGNFITRNDNTITFISIIQDSPKRKSLLKNFENTLIGTIYKKY